MKNQKTKMDRSMTRVQKSTQNTAPMNVLSEEKAKLISLSNRSFIFYRGSSFSDFDGMVFFALGGGTVVYTT